MINYFCVTLLVLINAFIHLTHAHSYHQSYDSNAGQGYPDTTDSYVTNFGNGNNKRNFVNIDETSDRTSISGTSFTNHNQGRSSVQKMNVDFIHQNYRGGPDDPNVNWNPAATRTQVTNIGNGVGNRNLFVINDRRNNQPYPENNQDSNNGYRGETNTGYQGRTRTITNIGKGPDNDNQIYVNNKRVYPNAVNVNGVQDPSASPESLPSANSVGQIQQNQGWTPNDNFNRPNCVTSKYGTGHRTPIPNGRTKNNYHTHNYNQVKFVNSNFEEVIIDPSYKEIPMRA